MNGENLLIFVAIFEAMNTNLLHIREALEKIADEYTLKPETIKSPDPKAEADKEI